MSFSNTEWSTTDYSLRNRLYAVIIRQNQDDPAGGQPRFVVGSVPDAFQLDHRVEWKTPMSGGLIKSEGLADVIAATTGNRLIAQVGTMSVWQGSGSETEFSLTFELRAWGDPLRDIIIPVKTLMSMALPSLDTNGFMKSPGAYLKPEDFIAAMKEAWTANTTTAVTNKTIVQSKMKNIVSVSVGRWLYFDNVVITGVQTSVLANTPYRGTGGGFFSTSLPIDAGLPQGVSVTMSFRPVFMMTAEDVETMFVSNGQKTIVENSSFVFNDAQPQLVDLFDPLAR
jgi:hypothetical protein